VPWGPIAWIASLVALTAFVPLVDHVVGNLAGYMLILAVITAGALRIDRWCSRQTFVGALDLRTWRSVAHGGT
jgi:hypothetical protein